MAGEPLVGEIRRGYEIGKADQRRAYIWKACNICGNYKWVRIHKGMPASSNCATCANRKRLTGKTGNQSIAWNGGISVRQDGYIKLYNPDYHHTDSHGYVLEHIYVWEKVHQQKLPDGYVIHHLNGIKGDNRPENLFAMKRGLHIGQSEPYKRKIRALEEENRLLRKALENNQMIFSIGEN